MGAIASQTTSLTIFYSIVYSDADQRKHQGSASLAFVRWIHRGPVNSPHKWPVTRKMFPFDDVIMRTILTHIWCCMVMDITSMTCKRLQDGASRYRGMFTVNGVIKRLYILWVNALLINTSFINAEKIPSQINNTDNIIAMKTEPIKVRSKYSRCLLSFEKSDRQRDLLLWIVCFSYILICVLSQ